MQLSSLPRGGNSQTLAFSQLILVCILAGKPLVDLIFFWEPAKYLYIGLLFLCGLLAYMGNSMVGRQNVGNGSFSGVIFYLLLAFYILHLFALNIYLNGNNSEIFKIISPFITVVIVGLCLKVDLRPYLKIVMAVSIIINFLSLPFDFAWVMWGSVKTFKGFYYFKMDLAFAVLNALVVYFFCTERKVNLAFAVLSLMVVIMIVLSNSRMNYLLVALFFAYVAFCHGISWQSIAKMLVLLTVVGIVAVFLYDPNKFISPFDTTNVESFTQGRNVIWGNIISKGLGEASIWEWLSGQGLFADYMLESYHPNGVIHNAHNELLHLLMTQGILGLAVYILLWYSSFKYLLGSNTNISGHARVLLSLILLFFLLQSITTVVITFYLKTWWLVCALICCRGNLSK